MIGLNYGYTIIRSSVARGVMGAGLHPTISIKHSNQFNAFRLVDDLMEPFRPIVDHACYQFERDGTDSLEKHVKEGLVDLLYQRMQSGKEVISLQNAAQKVGSSLAAVYEGEADRIDYPDRPLLG